MSGERLAALPGELCAIFLGWRLREDVDALLALGEGALRVDLRTAEAWCDGEPLPPLFIAGELARALGKGLEAAGADPADLREAQLDALFGTRTVWRRGREQPALVLSCRVTLHGPAGRFTAESNNAAPEP